MKQNHSRGPRPLLDTDLCPLDLLGEVPGLGTFEHVEAASTDVEIDGRPRSS